jgi:hypothetical protein
LILLEEIDRLFRINKTSDVGEIGLRVEDWGREKKREKKKKKKRGGLVL